MVCAGALGYPAPILINWEKNFTTEGQFAGGSHLGKITGISDYLDGLKPEQEEDIVVVVDGYDVWLQLRPQTLLDPFFDINRRANERIAKELGETAAQHGIKQTIVFGSQKRCWPWSESDPPCYAVPFSTLPEKVYGPETDQDIGDLEWPYHNFRPRFLNSGIVVGTVGSLRKLFIETKYRMENIEGESNFGSDQYIFSHVFGDQEVWRESLRLQSSQASQEPLHPSNPKHIEEVRRKASERPFGNLEFGIGLDYESAIGINTVFSERDTEFLTWSNQSSLRAAEEAVGVPSGSEHGHMHDLPLDITETMPPFWTYNNHEPDLPRFTK